MKAFNWKAIYLSLLLSIVLISCQNGAIIPPDAKQIAKELTIHGDTRIDNYYWLNERENPEVIAYLEAENNYTKAILKPTEKFQEDLFNEMKSRIKEDDESVPYKENGYFYYTRYETGKEYPIYCRKKENPEAPEEILLDVNKMADGFEYFHVSGLSISPDNKILAYGVDTVSRRKYTLYFKNIETGELFPETIINTGGSAAWANDNKTVFYEQKDDQTLREYKIFRHELGTGTLNDKEIFYEEDETFNTYVYKSKSEKYIIIGSSSTVSDEYRVLDANNPGGEFMVIQPREKGLEYSVSHFGDYFYIRTNLNAINFKLVKTPINKTGKENWIDVIPHNDDIYLENIEIFKNFLVLEERKDGLNQVRIIKWSDNSEHYLDFGEETYTAYISMNPDFDSDLLRYGYSSLTTPSSTIDYNMVTREKTIKKEQAVLRGFDKTNYESKRIFATASDGKKVAISLVYRKGIKLDGTNPALIYGYGSYGATMDPYFSSTRLSLLDRGFVYAIAHVRGEQYYGRQWYENGKLLNKINTFTDFIACSEYLIEQGYTSNEKLFAMGGSAGGLLMGAIANMRPDLYKGIVAQVPFVDVVTTMLDETIPLTTNEFDEWGNPKDSTYYNYMLSYSPYDQVKAQNYPAMLVTAGLHDSQVQYWEPAKWVAKLRDMKTDNNVLLLYTNMEAGHGGASGRFQALKEYALEDAFIFRQLGITE
ncbi:MAG: oligopeptidase B [Bacteroidetes bacterium GWC2_33_15]|nr:MAG: oligopeptidase B [Bacteroidetes bacterium GWA2_33_15]OFX50969.1 MAG: oligopeptidase B [Bacteroidetes bacterium GWC2_33_15]OFX66525.1 MAG: oligopeptidase B [Bacteroidetes bacterium GWB2_32_14]OFX70195.1 MAG: oligopeptidase B [Bacteroidetes bacterium GWD2_33_33]HAN19990.1 oligopeptidase B [Bacteroidales bacterium]